ncbi:ABC transporter ATP-binding protein [Oharaeibacter diazotrophicus]|uniref:Uncharacterized protein n=1 Tax=Oharaeibacter diazotrophicus TaxID=1920512 RepID=A0A4V3CVG9_9HYPH|nr:ABC transporter ATP-binding protein [Oharaeibacter diazotrophicus]TDP82478.1 hypothetical protein EDD54_3746 [Oharaeibacter diazotrophicus]BBE72759.1 hypothetical protein OHA_1_02357 [Pleomorphomonas sp. SM30]
MTHDEVRIALGASRTKFKRSPSSEKPADDLYKEAGLFCYYDRDGKLEAIEFFRPATPEIAGIALFDVDLSTARTVVSRLDPNLEVDSAGFTSRLLGVGVYAPLAKDDETAPIEGVIAFRPGYYDD